MFNLQNQFIKFHKKIKVELEELEEKRDIILDKIEKYFFLKKNISSIPILVEAFDQGSYKYGVGIKPINKQDYDIDVGLIFDTTKYVFHTPINIRKQVYNIVKKHTNDVEEKKSCIRVRYERGYHVDFVCYRIANRCLQLAHKNNLWIPSDQWALESHIEEAREKFKGTEDSSGSNRLQRVVRYLKRRNDRLNPIESDDKPTGLAILLYCIEASKFLSFEDQKNINDLDVLICIVPDNINPASRISVYNPSDKTDAFEKISNEGMEKLIREFKSLKYALLDIKSMDLLDACKMMRHHFGDDFPSE